MKSSIYDNIKYICNYYSITKIYRFKGIYIGINNIIIRYFNDITVSQVVNDVTLSSIPIYDLRNKPLYKILCKSFKLQQLEKGHEFSRS